jgi:hypothetical protein
MDRCCGCNFVSTLHDETIHQLQLFQNLLGKCFFKSNFFSNKFFYVIFLLKYINILTLRQLIVTGIAKQHKAQVVFFNFYFYFSILKFPMFSM